MPKTFLKPRHIEFIKANRFEMTASDMAKKFGCCRSVVQRYMRENGLHIPKEQQLQLRIRAIGHKTTSTPEIDKILKQKYLSVPVKVLGDQFGKSFTFVMKRLEQLGLSIPREIVEQRKAATRIQPGSVPPNKGKKMPERLYRELKRTMFKKGNVPMNTLYDGAVRMSYKKSIGYKYIRLAKNKWVPLHRYNWEQVKGPIPKGMALVFKDGDQMNCDVSNLELITREELMKRNTIHNLPKPIANTILLRGALNRQINKHLKRLNSEK